MSLSLSAQASQGRQLRGLCWGARRDCLLQPLHTGNGVQCVGGMLNWLEWLAGQGGIGAAIVSSRMQVYHMLQLWRVYCWHSAAVHVACLLSSTQLQSQWRHIAMRKGCMGTTFVRVPCMVVQRASACSGTVVPAVPCRSPREGGGCMGRKAAAGASSTGVYFSNALSCY